MGNGTRHVLFAALHKDQKKEVMPWLGLRSQPNKRSRKSSLSITLTLRDQKITLFMLRFTDLEGNSFDEFLVWFNGSIQMEASVFEAELSQVDSWTGYESP